MQTITATDLSRNFRVVLNRVAFRHEELLVVRNNVPVARLIPGGPATMTAAEVFADLYCKLPQEAGESWLADSRLDDTHAGEVRNPWGS